jgi:ribosome-associated protein
MNVDKLTHVVFDALDDLKAVDVRVLDVRDRTSITDVMVIATGSSSRHVKSLANNVVVKAKEQGLQPLGIEGDDVGEWVLIDLGDVVAHVMQAEVRDFYQLEKLWEIEPVVANEVG